ncbi:MAG: LuxR C-terminal-related transcriptional regulator [Treponema sp.]
MKKHLILIDDHPLMRVGIKNWFEKNSSWRVNYEAGSLEETENIIDEIKIQKLNSDCKTGNASEVYVAIVDLSFKDKYENSCNLGFDIIKKIKDELPEIKCIVFSYYENADLIEKAISPQIGANGYVSKNANEQTLLFAIENVASGKTFIQQELVPNLLEIRNIYNAFTKKERTVVNGIAKGLSNDEIASSMDISLRTVENYISHLYDKTDTENKIELLERLGLRSK